MSHLLMYLHLLQRNCGHKAPFLICFDLKFEQLKEPENVCHRKFVSFSESIFACLGFGQECTLLTISKQTHPSADNSLAKHNQWVCGRYQSSFCYLFLCARTLGIILESAQYIYNSLWWMGPEIENSMHYNFWWMGPEIENSMHHNFWWMGPEIENSMHHNLWWMDQR